MFSTRLLDYNQQGIVEKIKGLSSIPGARRTFDPKVSAGEGETRSVRRQDRY